jgi:hypothetical protein
MALLLQFFPDQGHHAHFAVARKGCRMGDISDPIAIALNVSDVRRSGPHLVPREIDVLGNLRAIERIGAPIGRHRSVKISALLIRHCLDRFWLGSSIIGDKNFEMTILPINGQSFWLFAKGILNLSGVDDFSRCAYQFESSSKLLFLGQGGR